MIAWLKANPDKATEGTAGLGSGQHISGVYFQKVTGTKFQFVPYGAGGPVDVLARTLSEGMRATLGQPIIIENVVGANGTIGVGRAVHATPDGYTVSIGNWPSHITNGAIYNLSYDIQRDFVPVARLPQNPYIAVVRKDHPAKNF